MRIEGSNRADGFRKSYGWWLSWADLCCARLFDLKGMRSDYLDHNRPTHATSESDFPSQFQCQCRQQPVVAPTGQSPSAQGLARAAGLPWVIVSQNNPLPQRGCITRARRIYQAIQLLVRCGGFWCRKIASRLESGGCACFRFIQKDIA